MKDDDTKKLENMYDSVAGVPRASMIIEEGSELSDLLTEELTRTLGQDNARRLVGLVKRDIPACQDEQCMKGLEGNAQMLIDNISRTVSDPMIRRTLSQYKQLSAVAKAKVLYGILAKTQ